MYIAWYHAEPDGGVTRLPLLTSDHFTWLPVLVTALVISIAAHIVLIVYDRYWLRETILISDWRCGGCQANSYIPV